MKKMYLALLIFLPVLILSGCSSNKSSDYYIEDDGQKVEIGNPYSADSGHYAGYEWAERTGNACSGNSTSFIEGCEEYYRQIENVKK
ncbi:MAG: hypothetical protein V1707_00820 [bacterium]